jgi:sirohydrochlorin ferrochelatase
MERKKAALIVGHGSRSKEAVAQFNQVVEQVRQNAGFSVVMGAHMELAEPDIPTVIKELADAATTDIVVVPYFLFMGNHIKKDIPDILNEQRLLYPHITFKLGNPIGFEPLVADILIKRATEAANQ